MLQGSVGQVAQADRNYDYPHNAKPFAENKPKSTTISGVVEDFDPVIERIASYVKRLSEVADRVAGPQPLEATGGEAQQEGITLIAKLQTRRQILVQITNYLEHIVDRFESTV